MFPNGADAYIDDISRLINLKDGSIRTAIDTGCGVRTILIPHYVSFIKDYFSVIKVSVYDCIYVFVYIQVVDSFFFFLGSNSGH